MSPVATADNVGPLLESDDVVSMRSLYYSTNLIFGPEWARYELEATVDGVPMTFSDDPAFGAMAATQGAPIRILFQRPSTAGSARSPPRRRVMGT